MIDKEELITISSGEAEQPLYRHASRYEAKFLMELRDNKRILGLKCPNCGHVYIPPRQTCRKCFVEMNEWVELSDKGTITAFTVVNYPFLDPSTGVERPIPYGHGFIQLDGADSALQHFIDETDYKKIKGGMRVRAVFEENRKGNILDIKHFEIIKE